MTCGHKARLRGLESGRTRVREGGLRGGASRFEAPPDCVRLGEVRPCLLTAARLHGTILYCVPGPLHRMPCGATSGGPGDLTASSKEHSLPTINQLVRKGRSKKTKKS